MAKQVVVDISAIGNVKIDALGFKGKECSKVTEHIEIAIGGSGKKKKTDKPEAFAPASTKGSVKQGF